MGKLGVAIPGAGGKMGGALVRIIAASATAEIAGLWARAGSPWMGLDGGVVAGVPPVGVRIVEGSEEGLARARVIIDFTTAAATAELVGRAAERGVGMVIGTTGLGENELRAVERAAVRIPVVMSANMSLGVNVMLGLLQQAARALGAEYDVEIVELHHRQKRDAPSGTALMMARALGETLGRELPGDLRTGRSGDVGPREAREIGVLAVRGGDIVGEHTAYFCGLGERIEIAHKATSRDTFARGALRAAEWLTGRPPGLYDMRDVLGLR